MGKSRANTKTRAEDPGKEKEGVDNERTCEGNVGDVVVGDEVVEVNREDADAEAGQDSTKIGNAAVHDREHDEEVVEANKEAAGANGGQDSTKTGAEETVKEKGGADDQGNGRDAVVDDIEYGGEVVEVTREHAGAKGSVITVKTLSEHCVDLARPSFTDTMLERCVIVEPSEINKRLPGGKRLNCGFFVLGVLYRITHVRHDASEAKESAYSKKPRRDYNRILYFGTRTGDTFSVILQSAVDSNSALKHCRRSIGIGRVFALYEPRLRDGAGIKLDQRVLVLTSPLFPMKLSLNKHLPTITPERPNSGQESFFLVRSTVAMLDAIQLPAICGAWLKTKHSQSKACCNGLLCDRQITYRPNQECGCLHYDRGISGIVLEYDLDFVDTEDRRNVDVILVKGQRSFRTTQLFVACPELLNQCSSISETERDFLLRDAIEKCSVYINQNGGFTVMGVKTVGSVNSGQDGIKNESESVTYHVVYLYPTDINITAKAEYKKLQYRPTVSNED